MSSDESSDIEIEASLNSESFSESDSLANSGPEETASPDQPISTVARKRKPGRPRKNEAKDAKMPRNDGDSSVPKTRRKPRAAQADPDRNTLFIDGFEGYFDQHKQREKISSTPFSRAPTLENADYTRLVRNHSADFSEIQKQLNESYTRFFNQWALELEQGHNVVIFGIGSKRSLIMRFVDWWNPPLPVIVANGYNPATAFREVLNCCVNTLVDSEEALTWLKTPSERLLKLLEYLETTQKRAVLVIHSMDGATLRDDRNRGFLTRLIACQNFYVIATVDHVNAPSLWTHDDITRMRFTWHHATTYAPMTTETAYLDVLGLGKSRTMVGAHGVKFVLESLTSNAQALYKLLVTVQYERMLEQRVEPTLPGASTHGIAADVLYDRCVAEFIVSNELNFRIMLAEFLEHKMAEKARKGTKEIVFVPYTLDDLEQILAET